MMSLAQAGVKVSSALLSHRVTVYSETFRMVWLIKKIPFADKDGNIKGEIEIVDVWLQQVQEISQEDAQAEGFELTGWIPTYSDPDSGGEQFTPVDNFAEAWIDIYGYKEWESNPWVWAIKFKVL